MQFLMMTMLLSLMLDADVGFDDVVDDVVIDVDCFHVDTHAVVNDTDASFVDDLDIDIDDDIECRVLDDLSTSEYNAIAIPTPPTDLTMYVDLTDLECGKDAFDKEYGF